MSTNVELLPAITVHGRFQPPLHVNHWDYIKQGFARARHVTVLITNPYNNEAFDASAAWRNDPTNNPFSFEERARLLRDFFTTMAIDPKRYDMQPFNIKDPDSFRRLDARVPNLINVYSQWSANKLAAFQAHGLSVIRLDQPKSVPISGTQSAKLSVGTLAAAKYSPPN